MRWARWVALVVSKQVALNLAPDQWEEVWAPEVAALPTAWPLLEAASLAQLHKPRAVDLAARNSGHLLRKVSEVAQPVFLTSAGLLSSEA